MNPVNKDQVYEYIIQVNQANLKRYLDLAPSFTPGNPTPTKPLLKRQAAPLKYTMFARKNFN